MTTHLSTTALKVWRSLFSAWMVILGGYAGYGLGLLMVNRVPSYRDAVSTGSLHVTSLVAFTLLGMAVTFLVAAAAFHRLVQTGERLREMHPTEKVAIFVGITIGLLLTWLLSPILLAIQHVGVVLTVLMGIVLVYLGIVTASSMKDELRLPGAVLADGTADAKREQPKLLDTNVIIDGRVSDICRTGFIEGTIYVPDFVLEELQHIADSSDALKRARGRRGLDILKQMRAELGLMIYTAGRSDGGEREEVDARLVKLAKELQAKIVTNDFNLNKVAELQGVPVLNINELANALKPVVLPGEEMVVTIIKEGKEMNQGIAYLDDGTMIVVEGARRRIGETLDVVTSSVLQTVAGKMIFATIREDEEEDESIDRSLRPYPRGGPRRKIQH